jgi:hypothetical protein
VRPLALLALVIVGCTVMLGETPAQKGALGNTEFRNLDGDDFNNRGYPSDAPLAVGARVHFTTDPPALVESSDHGVLLPLGGGTMEAVGAGASALLAVSSGVRPWIEDVTLVPDIPMPIRDFLWIRTAAPDRFAAVAPCFAESTCEADRFVAVPSPDGSCDSVPFALGAWSGTTRLQLGASAEWCCHDDVCEPLEAWFCGDAVSMHCDLGFGPGVELTVEPIAQPLELQGQVSQTRMDDEWPSYFLLRLDLVSSQGPVALAPSQWTLETPETLVFLDPPGACDGAVFCRVRLPDPGVGLVRVEVLGTSVSITHRVSR